MSSLVVEIRYETERNVFGMRDLLLYPVYYYKILYQFFCQDLSGIKCCYISDTGVLSDQI